MTAHTAVNSALQNVDVDRAVAILRTGGLVAFPTETVYGLGADACNDTAVQRIFRAKGRPSDNPLIAHVADLDTADRLVAHITPLARHLAEVWWPGPLTLVVPARTQVPRRVTGGLDTIGIRCPAHPVAQAMLEQSGLAVAAPSANRSGKPSPTTAAHVHDDLGAHIDLILDAGPSTIGLESTVVDARGDALVVLRDGAVTREQLGVSGDSGGGELERSPGTRYRHYAPRSEVRIVHATQMGATAARLTAAGLGVGAIAPTELVVRDAQVLARFDSSEQLAQELFAALRRADAQGCDVVLVAQVDEQGIGRAVMDRLRRAADTTQQPSHE